MDAIAPFTMAFPRAGLRSVVSAIIIRIASVLNLIAAELCCLRAAALSRLAGCAPKRGAGARDADGSCCAVRGRPCLVALRASAAHATEVTGFFFPATDGAANRETGDTRRAYRSPRNNG